LEARNVAIRSFNGGATWITGGATAVLAPYLVSVSCPSRVRCTAVGFNRSGVTVVLSPLMQVPPGQRSPFASRVCKRLVGVSCPTTVLCVAVGYARNVAPLGHGISAISDNGGTTWSSSHGHIPVSPLSAVSCPSTRSCVAVGNASVGGSDAATTTSGGFDLVEKQLSTPLNSALRRLVWLADPLRCRWMGGSVITTDGGTSWR